LKLLRIFSGDLDNNLEVLSNVDLEHFPQTIEGLLYRQIAKVRNNPLKVKEESIRTDVEDGQFEGR
jgi:hypothetical protein